MHIRCLLQPGAVKILDKNDDLLGFALGETTIDGQVQRWLFRRKPESFSVVSADLDVPLPAWKAMVSQPAPDARRWGEKPEAGLWLPNALYVVAKSVVYSHGERSERCFPDLPLPLPEPSFLVGVPPERSARAIEIGAGPSKWLTDRQLDLGDREIFQRLQHEQFERKVGYAFGFGGLTKPAQSDTWTSIEYWVLFDSYQPAGTRNLRTYLRKGRLPPDADLAEFHALAKGAWGKGCALEVTGCSNYQGLSPPPADVL